MEEVVEILSPPVLHDVIPLTVSNLERLWTLGQRSEVGETLAALYLKNERFEEAFNILDAVHKLANASLCTLTNLGIACFNLQKYESAISYLSQAILLSPQTLLPYKYLLRLALREDDEESISRVIERIERSPCERDGDIDALLLHAKGRVSELRGDLTESHSFYRAAYQLMPSLEATKSALVRLEFAQGEKLFLEREFRGAYTAWAATRSAYGDSFHSNQEIQNRLTTLERSSLVKNQLVNYREQLINDELSENSRIAVLRDLFAMYFFTIGLSSEIYVSDDLLSAQLSFWLLESEKEGVYPYAHFRVGVLRSLAGDLDAATESFSFARDHLPNSKKKVLKVDEIIAFIENLREATARTELPQEVQSDDWDALFEPGSFVQRVWKQTGLTPLEAREWETLSFSPAEAQAWTRQGFSPTLARTWHSAGVRSADVAKKWLRVTKDYLLASRWHASFYEQPEIGIQCYGAGFTEPEEAKEWMRLFSIPWDAARWRSLEIPFREAAVFVTQGITDPLRAKAILEERASDETHSASLPDEEGHSQ